MNFFKKKINKEGGFVKISGQKLICRGREGHSPLLHDDEVNIEQLKKVYFVIDKYGIKSLFFDDGAHYHIPVSFKGFSEAYQQLSKKYGFNDELFRQYINTQKPVKVCLWRKQLPETYHLLPEEYGDLANGFEIQSAERAFISWDIPLKELEKCPHVKMTKDASSARYLTFKYPIRIGALELKEWGARLYQARKEVPVLGFYTQCYNSANSFKSYRELKTYFSSLNEIRDQEGWEREDQCYWSFEWKGMRFELTYWFDDEHSYESGYTSLEITNNREYPELLMDECYEATMVLSQYLILDRGDIFMQADYKKNSRVIRRPPKLEGDCRSQPVIWIDRKNNKIGFATKEISSTYPGDGYTFKDLSQVFDVNEIKGIYVCNVFPAKGGGYAELKLDLHGQKYLYTVLEAGCQDFDSYTTAIASITGKQVKYLPDGNDG